MTTALTGAYDASDDLVDYILGITFEIWEAGGIDLIDQYYSPETVVWSLDGITHGAAAMIEGTKAVLGAFPDRLLLADDVITAGDAQAGYSSHRVLSPMTNTGASKYGPATGRQVRIMNMADCVVEDGVITREWLVRDNLALVRQLGFDVREAAAQLAAEHTDELRAWFASERERLQRGAAAAASNAGGVDAQAVLQALWNTGDETTLENGYAEYAVLHRSPVDLISGRDAIMRHFEHLRNAFRCEAASIDHSCEQSEGKSVVHSATRWAVAALHEGTFLGVPASGKPVFIMGVTHRKIVAGRIAAEWTVFDNLGVLAQLL